MLLEHKFAKPHCSARTVVVGGVILLLLSLLTMALMTSSIPFSKPAISLADIWQVEQKVNAMAGTIADTAAAKAARASLKNARECFEFSRLDDARRHLECAEINAIIAKQGDGAAFQIKQDLQKP